MWEPLTAPGPVIPPPAGTLNVWTPRIALPGGAPRYTVSNCSPTTWKWHGCVGPASTTQKRARSPTFTRIGSFTYWFGRPLNVTKSGSVVSIFW